MTASAEPQEVLPVDGRPFAGELLSIAAPGEATFREVAGDGSPGVRRTIPFDALVRWGHPVAPRPQTIVVLKDGGQIVTAADWSGGAAVRLENNTFLVLSDTFGELPLTREMVRGIVFALRKHANERGQLVRQTHTFDNRQDTILLANGDQLTGKLTRLERGSLTMDTSAGEATLPLSRVEAVIFANMPHPDTAGPPEKATPRIAAALRDGSLVYAATLQAAPDHLSLRLQNGVVLEGGTSADIAGVQSLAGSFVYLSDMDAADYRHVPYLAIDWPFQRDRNVLGASLAVDGKQYLKGLGMHSASRLTYRLDRKFTRFEALVAVDDSAGKRGSVTFGVYLLRGGTWEEAYVSDILRGGDAPRPVSVDISGAQGLTLTVDYADRGDELDRGNWLDARVVSE